MKTIEGHSTNKNHLTERDIKFLKVLRIREKESAQYTKSDIDFLRRAHRHGRSFIHSIKRTNPKHLTAIDHLSDLYDDLLTAFGTHYLPNYHNNHEEIDSYEKNHFTENDIDYLKKLRIAVGETESICYTDNDIDFLRRAHKNEDRFIPLIKKTSPRYLAAVQRLAKLYYDLITLFSIYYLPTHISEIQNHLKEKQMIRTKDQFPFPDLDSTAEVNRRDKQMKLRLPPALIEAVNKAALNQGLPRNVWVKRVIKKELTIESLQRPVEQKVGLII